MAKNGIWLKKFLVNLIYLISRVFLAWTFLNFLACCVSIRMCTKFINLSHFWLGHTIMKWAPWSEHHCQDSQKWGLREEKLIHRYRTNHQRLWLILCLNWPNKSWTKLEAQVQRLYLPNHQQIKIIEDPIGKTSANWIQLVMNYTVML